MLVGRRLPSLPSTARIGPRFLFLTRGGGGGGGGGGLRTDRRTDRLPRPHALSVDARSLVWACRRENYARARPHYESFLILINVCDCLGS